MPEAKLSVEVEAKIDKLKSGFADGKAEILKFSKSILQLEVQMKSYQAIVNKSLDPAIITKYNTKIQEVQAQIKQMSNTGKTGFDEFGNAIKETVEKSTNGFQKAYSGLLKLSYILPGIGIAGIFTLAFDAILPLVAQLDLFKSKLSESQQAAKLMNDALASSTYTDAVKNVNELTINIGLAKEGFLSKEKVLKQYNDTIGKTTGHVGSLDEAEKALTKNGPAFIRMTLLKASAQLALDEAAKKAFQAAQIRNRKSEDVATFGDKAKASFNSGLFTAGETTGFGPEDIKNFQNQVKIGGAARRKSLAAEVDKEGNEFEKIAGDFQKRAAEISKGLNFDFFGGTEDPKKIKGKTRAELLKELAQLKADSLINGLEASMKLSDQPLEQFKKSFEKDTSKTFSSLTDKPLIPIEKIFGEPIPYVTTQLYKPFEALLSDVGGILLPELGSSFQTFFDDMLMHGTFSFNALGQSILKTFTSVLANQATTGLLSLLGDPAAQKKGNIFKSLGSLLGIGAGAVGSGGGAAGAGAAAAGTAASGGLLLPILGGIAAGGLIASLFKKKDRSPSPAYVTNNNLSSSSGGAPQMLTVTMRAQGRDLVGVLNLEGYYLSRVHQNGRGG